MRKLLIIGALLAGSSIGLSAQAVLRVQKFCEQGGYNAVTQGLNSTTKVQRSFPSCTVTVYLTGTTTLASIYSDQLSPPTPLANPFTANVDGSFGFYVATSSCYDIVTSGGTSPNTFPSPFTYANVCVGSGGGGGGGVNPGTPKQVTRYNSSGTNIEDSSGSDDPANGPTRWTNGLSVEGAALHKLGVNSPNGTTLNLLVCADATVTTMTQVTTCTASSNKTFGIADNGAGTSGNVRIADHGYHACVFDNQTVVNDYVAPSASVAGQCSDVGSTKPNNVLIIGRVTTLNTGASTLATVDLQPWDTVAPGSAGGSGTVSNCGSSNSNAYYPGPGTVVACDQFVTDDGAGNMTAKSLGLTDTSAAGYMYMKQGAQPPATPANTRMDTVGASVTTYTVIHPSAACTPGQTEVVQSTSTDGNGNTIETRTCGSTGSAVSITATSPIVVTPSPITGTGVISCPTCSTGASPQAANPTAPTLTPFSPGSTSYTYAVVGCEDPACGNHSALSATTTTSAGNASLATGPITLTNYANTLYGYRFYKVCRTASSGTPSSTGVIATGAWKSFADNGLAGDGTNCASVYASNTTQLDTHCLAAANPSGNVMPGTPCGIDAPPTSPNASNSEFTETFGIADANDPFWTWVNQNSATATLTGGMVSLTAPSRGVANNMSQLNCLFQPAPSTPYTVTGVDYSMFDTSVGGSSTLMNALAFRESATGKIEAIGNYIDNGHISGILVTKWASATVNSSIPVNSVQNYVSLAANSFQLNADGTNVKLKQSNDGLVYFQSLSEAKNAFFTTAPDQIGICIMTSFGAGIGDWDYFRVTSP